MIWIGVLGELFVKHRYNNFNAKIYNVSNHTKITCAQLIYIPSAEKKIAEGQFFLSRLVFFAKGFSL
jgi:hypothetical protein